MVKKLSRPRSHSPAESAKTLKAKSKSKILAKTVARPAKVRSAPPPPPPPTPRTSAFSPGDRIMHRVFGQGVVTAVDLDKLEIKFKTVGVKWILDAFVKPR